MENEHEVKINVVELASELAHHYLMENWSGKITICIHDEETNCEIYTEEAQDLFNQYYDEYYTLILSCKS